MFRFPKTMIGTSVLWQGVSPLKGNRGEWSTDQSNSVSQNVPCSAQRNPRDAEENFTFPALTVIFTRVFSTGMNYFWIRVWYSQFSVKFAQVSKTCREFWNRKTLLLEIVIGLPVAPNYGMSFLSRKKTKWERLTQRGLRVPLPLQWSPFLREGTGHFRSSGEQIW